MTQKRSRGDVIYLIGMRRVFWRDGAAALPTMLVISSVIMEIAIAGAFLAFVFVRSGLAARINAEAVTVARAGVQDALLRLVRDKSASSAGYSLSVGSYSTTVIITNPSDCTSGVAGKVCITSESTVLTRRKKFQAITAADSTTGEVRVISLSEVAI